MSNRARTRSRTGTGSATVPTRNQEKVRGILHAKTYEDVYKIMGELPRIYEKSHVLPDADDGPPVPTRNQEKVRCILHARTHEDVYKIMGVNRASTIQDVEKAFRKLALQIHPDKHSSPDKGHADKAMKKVGAAVDRLKKQIIKANENLSASQESAARASAQRRETEARARAAREAAERVAREAEARAKAEREAREEAERKERARARAERHARAQVSSFSAQEVEALKDVGLELLETVFDKLTGNSRPNQATREQEEAAWKGVKTIARSIVERQRHSERLEGESVVEMGLMSIFLLTRLLKK